ncbi:hypothetical protein HAX54_010166 [Datura stramonium]|uniref:Uncharacterized protein n=1 Tax=Datura stramonium TaxID=4076 RepID=A0ABS8THQ5_DATST|nr:hypothetical protein [Datura stramonium]
MGSNLSIFEATTFGRVKWDRNTRVRVADFVQNGTPTQSTDRTQDLRDRSCSLAGADQSSDDGESHPSHALENGEQLFEEADMEKAFPATSKSGGVESDTDEISQQT